MTALHHPIVLVLIIALEFLLSSDRKNAILQRKRDVLVFDAWKFGLDQDLLIDLLYVHMRGNRDASASAGAEYARECWQATGEAVEQTISDLRALKGSE